MCVAAALPAKMLIASPPLASGAKKGARILHPHPIKAVASITLLIRVVGISVTTIFTPIHFLVFTFLGLYHDL
jgi:hypothetical protein